TSSNIPLPLLSFGTWVAIAGLDTPGIVLTLNIAPTSIAPVLPADANESMTPFFKSSKPLATLELGFWVMALVGWSCIEMFSGACTYSNSEVSTPARSEEHTSELQSRENLVCRLL